MIPGITASRRRGGIGISGAVFGGANLESYSAQFEALGAAEPVTWSILSGSLPAGLHLVQDGSKVVQVAGVPNATVGYYTTTLRVEDSNGLVAEKQITLGIGNIVTLLRMDGTNGQTSISDAAGKTWSRGGNAQLTTAQKVFGTASSLHDGAGDYWSSANHADFRMGGSDFTISTWVRPTGNAGASDFRGVVGKRNGSSNAELTLYRGNNNGPYFMVMDNTTTSDFGQYELNEWRYLTVSKKGTQAFTGYQGDVSESAVAMPATITGTSNALRVGVLGQSANESSQSFYGWLGQIDEFKIVKGAATHNEDFTPPAAPSDYPQSPAALAVSGALPAGIAATSYSSTTDITIHGANTPFAVSVSDGTLPSGWSASVSGSNVQVSGPGVAAGDYYVELEIEDSASNHAYLPVTIRVV